MSPKEGLRSPKSKPSSPQDCIQFPDANAITKTWRKTLEREDRPSSEPASFTSRAYEASPRGVGMRRATRSEITPPWESRSPRLPIQPFLDMHRTPLLLQSLATGRQPILPPYTSPIFRRTSSVAISSAAARYSGRLPALDPQKTQIRFTRF